MVYSDGLLEHFVTPKPVLKEIFRVSKEYVLTMVARITLYNLIIHDIVFRPPEEYKKKDHEWVELHKELDPGSVEFETIRFGILMILCEKGRSVR